MQDGRPELTTPELASLLIQRVSVRPNYFKSGLKALLLKELINYMSQGWL